MKNQILIISFFFPPCNKVGGRRWAKFAKYLTKSGHNVHVVCVDYPLSGKCPWESDISTFENNIQRIPYRERRPFYQVHKAPATVGGKIRYRLSWYGNKFIGRKANEPLADISLSYGKQLRDISSSIIEKNGIDHVIVTGGPFQWCYDAMQLKKKYQNIKFILDLRDFWTGGENYSKLSDQSKVSEDEKELECIELSDATTTPADKINEYLKLKYKSNQNKIHVLPHAYDKEEMPVDTILKNEPFNELSFAYAGILYPGMDAAIQQLINLLSMLIKKGIKIKLDLYTFDKSYKNLFDNSELKEDVNYNEPLSSKYLFAKLVNYDVLLQLRAGNSFEQHFKSTKFYELIALRKPILYFGPKGDVSDFLVDNKLGFDGNTDPKKMSDDLISNKKDRHVPDRNFDVSNYEFGPVTQQLLTYF